ncbi:hypothetical protein [Caldalkalibacillus salinus]|uniref:hypothetical protein n=1 Tax=Caldalkalibacillus salinus TaxID=2803787 RepID=UPI001922CFB0|nr:hypothetical protein [Caldalkalibacillus salinus]
MIVDVEKLIGVRLMHHMGYFPWFGTVFLMLLFGFLIYNMIWWRRNRSCHSGGAYNALDMLEKRYVNGEIDEAQFKIMKENLRK